MTEPSCPLGSTSSRLTISFERIHGRIKSPMIEINSKPEVALDLLRNQLNQCETIERGSIGLANSSQVDRWDYPKQKDRKPLNLRSFLLELILIFVGVWHRFGLPLRFGFGQALLPFGFTFGPRPLGQLFNIVGHVQIIDAHRLNFLLHLH